MVIPCTSQASDNNVLGEFGAKLNRHVGVIDTRDVVDGRLALVVAHAATERLDAARRQRRARRTSCQFEFNRGNVKINADTFGTTVDGVFAVGDFVTGPATIIEAAGLGRRAARAVDRWLPGCAAWSSKSCPSSTAP